jgi:polar amino acid transport system permease protein
MLVQLYIVYFALPFIGIEVPAVVAGILALGINSGAYISEVVRSGLESIEKEQWEAGSLDGATHIRTLISIILPQAFRRITPGITNELTMLLKGSSLLTVIAIFELTRAAEIVGSRHFEFFLMYLCAGLIYLLMVSILIRITNLFERNVS